MSTNLISIIWIFYIDEIIAQERRWHGYSFYFTGYAINFAQIFQEKNQEIALFNYSHHYFDFTQHVLEAVASRTRSLLVQCMNPAY